MLISNETSRRWWLLSAVSCVLGLVLLDETVVGIALPTIQETFGLSDSAGHWVVNAYLLSFACLVAVGGKLADLFGILRMFLIGLTLFALCSIACGFAPTGEVLLIARVFQGVGAAIIFPIFLAMITMTFPKDVRGAALATSSAVGTIFLALGPLVGGLFTDLLSWRWIFWINPFFALAVGVIVTITWRDVDRPPGERIDWRGLVLISAGLCFAIFALMQADSWGWSSPVIWALLLAGVALLWLFFRVEAAQDLPLIEVRLFSSPVFAASNLSLFMTQYAKMPLFVFVALYAQSELKLSPLWAGVLVMLAPVLTPPASALCGRIADKTPKRRLVACGLTLLLVSSVWLLVTEPMKNAFVFAPGLVIAGLSFPFLFTPTRAAIAEALPEYKHGQGGGIAMTSQVIGGTVGLAASSAAFALGGYQAVFALSALLTVAVMAHALIGFRGV
ncbi:MAG: MFS transporter [Pseudomonadota bacterium]